MIHILFSLAYPIPVELF